MKQSPKIVAVDLAAESRKRSRSPNSTSSPLRTNQSLDFSFSHQNSPFIHPPSINHHRSNVSKNLFGKVPQEVRPPPSKYQNYNSTSNNMSKSKTEDKQGLNKRRDRNDRLLKKSLDKLKKTFFSGVRNDRDRTVKTLKEIGRYAKSRAEDSKKRSRQKQKDTRMSPYRQKNIPVEFVGFDPNQTQSRYKRLNSLSHIRIVQSKQGSRVRELSPNRATEDKGTYYNFEEQLKHQLKYQQSLSGMNSSSITHNPFPSTSGGLANGLAVSPHIPETVELSPSAFETINQIQIDVVCQIFEMCEKYDEGDKIVLGDFVQLLKEFERLYFIRVIQQSEAGSSRVNLRMFESQFNELLRDFEDSMRVVFYRKEACDIYDCLYYLKESNRLDKLCSLFLGIKKMLDL